MKLPITEQDHIYYILMGYEIKLSDHSVRWKLNGKLHREDGPAIIWDDGTLSWYLNGKCHREDGPAEIDPDGTQRWYFNNELHRIDGPARVWGNGNKEWWLHHTHYETEEEFNEAVKLLV